jgi:hypothetical protein
MPRSAWRSPWRLVDVPGIGHDDRLMARAAWPLLDESPR